ncbi:MAG: winged helix-turn-helix domain-containing protein [Candidatus Glassbacteria bacterium]
MKVQIGHVAGDVWKVLKQRGEVNVEQLPKLLKMKASLVYQGLGWLAREDKVSFRTQGEKTLVSLAD